jgi:hypothetical protein
MRTGIVYRVGLSGDGRTIAGAPLEYFRNATRYRDTAVAPDGRRIYVVTDNGGFVADAEWRRTEVLEHPGTLLEFTYAPVDGKG